jgi:hypothetical protein
MTQKESMEVCEHCRQTFKYSLAHCGFGDCAYAYCDSCGKTAILSMWYERIPELPNCPWQQEMCAAWEPYLQPCACGGTYKNGASPRCPHCSQTLSAGAATVYIEPNAPGTKKGWRWQRNWHETYCIVIENRVVKDNYKDVPS